MGKLNLKKCAVAVGAVLLLAAAPANAALDTASFDLTAGNAAIAGFAGPYAHVTIERNSLTDATITFTSLVNGGNIYLLGGSGQGTGAVAVNVNAGLWTVGSITGSINGTGFTPGPFSNGASGHMDGFGSFNQTILSDDGFSHSADRISFSIVNSSGTWASASDVLIANAGGNLAAAHIWVTADPANAANGALATGFAAVPEPTTVIAGALLLLPFAASAVRIVRKNRKA